MVAVGDTPKAIADTGVFAITSLFSLWAYIWLYLTLEVFSKEKVELWEAWLTLFFFFILIIISFGADKLNGFLVNKQKSLEEKEE